MIALRACSFVTTRQVSALCFFSQKHFMRDDIVIKDANVIGFFLSAISS